MIRDDPRVAAETRRVLSIPDGAALDFHPIEKGGSDRSFHRVTCDGAPLAILMRYGNEREENGLFVGIGRYLEDIGVPVPHILGENVALRLVWLQDLGTMDLCALSGRPWPERRALYGRAVEGIASLHRRDPEEPAARGLALSPGFDARLYHWEHEYFLENFVGRVCGLPADGARASVVADFGRLTEMLLAAPRALVHRDFQSQNIMVQGEGVGFVDFQGMRVGTAYYDLASLLFDPYVALSAGERDDLLRDCGDLYEVARGGSENFRRMAYVAGCQRLMQALGAYGFLGLVKGRAAFLAHVPRGLRRLLEAIQGAADFPRLGDLARRCGDALDGRPQPS